MTKFFKELGKILSDPISFFFPPPPPQQPPEVPKWVAQQRPKPVSYHKKDSWRKGIKRNITVVGPVKTRY